MGNVNIKVIGVGGGGCNAIGHMMRSRIKDVELVAVNTDVQALGTIEAHQMVHIGVQTTQGLSAGGQPEVGRTAAEESRDQLADLLKNVDMLFITAGMGGGTGSGAAPVIAELARAANILTVGIVTYPFSFEGTVRAQRAQAATDKLRKHVDALLDIPNDRLLKIASPGIKLNEAFALTDMVLQQGVQGITDLITMTGLINLDFADIDSVIRGAGTAIMGIGEGRGPNRIKEAVRKAVTSPLLDYSIQGAQHVILNITGGNTLTLEEVAEAATQIREVVLDQADLLFGTVLDDALDSVRVTVIATGFKGQKPQPSEPQTSQTSSLKILKEKQDKKQDLDIPTFLRSP